jgi:hypothetical protein
MILWIYTSVHAVQAVCLFGLGRGRPAKNDHTESSTFKTSVLPPYTLHTTFEYLIALPYSSLITSVNIRNILLVQYNAWEAKMILPGVPWEFFLNFPIGNPRA